MKRLAATLGLLLSLTWAAPVVAQAPIARAELLDPAPVLVSSGARLAIEVLVPTFFRGPVQFPDEIELPDAIVRLAPGSSTNLNERIDGASWAGIRRTYHVYPTRPGRIEIGALPITIVYALDNGSGSEPTTVETTGVSFDAYLPEAARGLSQFFASENFELDAVLEPATTVRVGETVTRTFTMSAQSTPGLFLPRLDFPELEGARVYPGQPALEESGGERGTARTAERVESVTYTFTEEGNYELPAVTVNWRDSANQRLVTDAVDAVTITVEPNPDLDAAMTQSDLAAESAPEEVGRVWVDWLRSYWRWAVGAGLALMLLLRVGLPTLHNVAAWLAVRRADHAESEGRYFRDFVTIARRGDAASVYRALTRWFDRWAPSGETLAADQFAARYGDAALREAVEALTAAAFSGAEKPWSRQAIVRGVENARRRHDATRRTTIDLPPLNPPNRARQA